MKITVIQDRLRSGGTERQSIFLTRAFAAAGHASTLLTFRPGGVLGPEAKAIDRRSLQPFDLGLDWFAPGLFREIAGASPHIVLCMGRMANCYGGLIQDRCPQAAVIATLRTGKSLPWLFRRSLRLVRGIVANSREARDRLVAEHGLPAAKIEVIYNSLVFPSFPRREEALRARFGAGPGTIVLLCVAMFRPEKNQAELVRIAAELPPELDWQLWLAGEGPARGPCERLVSQLGLEKRIKFPGFLPDPTGLYSAADVAVHASASESLSNFLIEAQAGGLPAVAYEAQGVRECFLPGRTGWAVARGDRASFRSALGALAAEPPAVREERSAAARTFARTAFDASRQAAAYLELFRRLLPEG